MLPTKFRFIWRSGFRGEDFLKSTNQKQELPVDAMFVNGSELNEQFFYIGPSKDASYPVLIHLAKRLQRRLFKIGQSETRIACGGHIFFIEDLP